MDKKPLMKISTEITRFLNHVERENDKIRTELSSKIATEHQSFESERFARISAERELEILREKNIALEAGIALSKVKTDSILSAARAIIPRLRVNIYTNSTKSTPRWFKTGKYWSRETGAIDPKFVAEMTVEEIQEGLEFYGRTELPLMLPISHSAEIAEAA